jgi:two-component system alkaline phosphatase synthesis response regulator PhoP
MTATPKRVLLIEDNEKLALGLRHNLEFEGYEVRSAADAATGLAAAYAEPFDLVILDLMLPDMNGYRVLEQLREEGNGSPVLILTALGEEADKVRGFRLGADDYVTKPFGLMELMARVDALIRRAQRVAPAAPPALRIGEVTVNPMTRTVHRNGDAVSLRPKEFELLVALLRRNGAVATRQELLSEVWGYDESVMSRTVDTHIAELRRKLEDDPASPRLILTVLKTGYRAGVES